MSKRSRGDAGGGVGIITLLDGDGSVCHERVEFNEVDARSTKRDKRILYPVPVSVIGAYLAESSGPFRRRLDPMLLGSSRTPTSGQVLCAGDAGLVLCTCVAPPMRCMLMSVEAAALYQLVSPKRLVESGDASRPYHSVGEEWQDDWQGDPQMLPDAIARFKALSRSWSAGMNLVMACPNSGWRGCYAEKRLWLAVSLRMGQSELVQTDYALSSVRSWFPTEVLDDLIACASRETLQRLAKIVCDHKFEGAPDLVLWRPGSLRIVEVKSQLDDIKDAQVTMLTALGRVCPTHVVLPERAKHRDRIRERLRNASSVHAADTDDEHSD
jgi:hypothetical protein